tara:strand:- start:6075 stop:6476 length:402 start_codon:yes stop_codon:yes gene_type:complete
MPAGLLEKVYTGLNDMIRSQRIHISEAKERLALLERLYESDTTIVTYHVKTTSLWADHGEKPVKARSVDLKRAIRNAGKKHHQVNKRTDWQVRWKVNVEFSDGDNKASYELHTDMYKDLLPGRQVPTPPGLKT